MNKRTCYAVVLLMLMFSCSGQNALKDNLTVLPWEFSENESIPDLIDSVEFIVLEAHPEGLFKKADKLIVQNNKFFIFDMTGQNQVSVFDNAGKFLYRVGSRGNGPGEYVGIRNFTTDEKYIHIIDNYTGKLLMYHIADGTYAGTKKLPFIAHDMIIAENGDYVFARQRMEGE
ncbi:MAG: 6-bladed beta-propeller [Bacteroidales bacterium]|jgi:hypothetical protein|nr:6-bladed beta-propeller [Bacteroidales bacterium]